MVLRERSYTLVKAGIRPAAERLVFPRLSLVSLLLTVGCATGSTLQSAHTLAPGRSQFGVEVNYYGVSAFDDAPVFIPQADFTFRYGLVERFEIGGRLGVSGLSLMGKYQLTAPHQPGIAVSLAPSAGGVILGVANLVNAQLPVVIGVPLGEGTVEESTHLVFAPKLQGTFGNLGTSNAGIAGFAASVGASVGLSLKLGETARIIPEASVLYNFYGNAAAWVPGASTGGSGATNSAVFNFGLAFLFGSS